MGERQKPTRLYLVRHGEVVRRGQGKFLGFTDLPLSARGRRQVQALAEHLKDTPLNLVFSSDLKRTMETAEIICRGRGIRVQAESAFREMDMGLWDGKSWVEIRKAFPDADPRFYDLKRFHFPGGEHWGGFRRRILKALKGLLEMGKGRNILLSAHAGVNRVILAQALGLPFRHMFRMDQGHACLNIVVYYEKGVRVERINAVYP
jgi:alpha-ribazole phosphatase